VVAVDAVTSAVLDRGVPSREAAVLAWAGGALHDRQADACLQVLGAGRVAGDVHVRRVGPLACLADPASARCAEQAAAFSPRQRGALAGAVLAAAGEVAGSGAGLAERVVARLAVHRVRSGLDPAVRDQLPRVQCALIRGMEALGDMDAARQVAAEALAGTPAGRRELLMTYLRLARTRGAGDSGDPLAEEAISVAVAAGAVIGLEARVWAATELLGRDGNREQALALAGQVSAELAARTGLGQAGDQWRLLLAFAAGRAGVASLAQQLLGPMLNSGIASREKPAQAVLRAVSGPRADTRLQIILLQAELDTTPVIADQDQLRLHHALTVGYASLGMYPQALSHGHHELGLRKRLQHPGHPATLVIRGNIALWTGECGDAAGALRLFTALQPDMERVLGPDHPHTLRIRGNVAFWTGECGDAAAALQLLAALLPDQERVLGPAHLDTLHTRSDIAFWTGECGDAARALRLFTALLPDQEQAFGPGHLGTLAIRHNIAAWTGRCGDVAEALRLSTALLPDQVRLLGPGHPDTLATRNNIAAQTGECGDAARALRLFTALLPDQERVLGPGHPDTLLIRSSIAAWTGRCGDAAGALRLSTALLPDQERLLGPDHPDTLTTRRYIGTWTAQIRRESCSTSDQQPLAELGGLAGDALATGDTAAAVSYCEQMIDAAEQAFGSLDIRLTRYLRQAAGALAAANQGPQAIDMLTRAVTINDYYGAETAEAVSALRDLAVVQQQNGRHQEARQNLHRALDIEARHSRATA
jgi:tetratricopeptide (TPR) repeat protein